MIIKAFDYLFYRIFTPHRKGFGIHSPFVYQIISEILIKKDDLYLTGIKEWRNFLMQKNDFLSTIDAGAGSIAHQEKKRSVSSIIKRSSISHKYGRILYYMAKEFKPETILELGTGLGISTAYLAGGNLRAKLYSIDTDMVKVNFAEKVLQILEIPPPVIINGMFENVLLSNLESATHPIMIFVDGDHQYESLLRIYNDIIKYKRFDTIIIFDDIRWSKGMLKAWNEIKDHQSSVISIDLFFMGIIFFREGILKQNFKINF